MNSFHGREVADWNCNSAWWWQVRLPVNKERFECEMMDIETDSEEINSSKDNNENNNPAYTLLHKLTNHVRNHFSEDKIQNRLMKSWWWRGWKMTADPLNQAIFFIKSMVAISLLDRWSVCAGAWPVWNCSPVWYKSQTTKHLSNIKPHRQTGETREKREEKSSQ